MDWLRYDPVTGAVEVVPAEAATHFPREWVGAVEDQLRIEQEKTTKLYERLQRQIKNKVNWRDRALAAQGKEGERRQLRQAVTAESDAEERECVTEKGEVRPYSGKHYRVLILELEAETDEEGLAEAGEVARVMTDENRIPTSVGRLWKVDIEWFAELLVAMPTDRSMAPRPPEHASVSAQMRAIRMLSGGGGRRRRK